MLFFFFAMTMSGHAIEVFQRLYCEAEVAVITNKRQTCCDIPSINGRVFQRTWLIFFVRFGFCEAGNAVVFCFAIKNIKVPCNVARTAGNIEFAKALFTYRFETDFRFTRCALWDLSGNAVIDNVDHSANRAASVLQCCRTAQNFDLCCGGNIGCNIVVSSCARGIRHI